VHALLDAHYPLSKYKRKSHQWKAFKQDAPVSWSTVQRALQANKGKTIDVIADIAAAFEVPASDLLRPDFARIIAGRRPSEGGGDGDGDELQRPASR
jgi:hypothetical protein